MLKESINTAISILKSGLPEFTAKFKPETSVNNYYIPGENIEWTPGFLTGQYWLAWELTGDDSFKDAALVHVCSFDARIRNKIQIAHHDMGFLYSLSCVAAWKLTGSKKGREAAILAADNLISRFHPVGNFIQAWGEFGAKENYRLIIDCLMNLPLLYWATEETGDPKYREIAELHTETSLKNLVRDDFSTYHTYYFNPQTGEPDRGTTAQGYKDSSPWARGQAWGIYGTALAYLYTKNPICIDLFCKITDFFIHRVKIGCSDMVPYWDLIFTDDDLDANGKREPKDSSAAAIACCGMLEMAKYLPKDKAEYYINIAKEMANALALNYAAKPEESNGLLLHGVYGKSSPYNTVSDIGVDECTIWGDYFWLETLMRLLKMQEGKEWEMYW
ncbi:MAG: glycoside hydrolase family 88 protein [Defluviitaleaceae bacterium]|nr:glycoside hydrolase family 88 protein [Defluviitaleaceae bacterium]